MNTLFANGHEVLKDMLQRHADTFDQTLPWLEEFQDHILTKEEVSRFVTDCGAVEPGARCGLPVRRGKLDVGLRLRVPALLSFTNYYSANGDPVERGESDESVRDLARQLRLAAADVTAVDFGPLAADGVFLDALGIEFSSNGWRVERYVAHANWYVNVSGTDFNHYLSRRPGPLRSTLQRKSRKLKAMQETTLRILTRPEDMGAALALYEAVYTKSWKVDEPYKQFIRNVVRRFAEQDWVRLGVLEIAGRPAAAQIWFNYRGVASIFKLAYDPEFTHLSVGSVLTAELMKHALDVDKVAVVDFLSGDDEYKKDWMECRRERIGFRAVRSWSLAGAIDVARVAARTLRRRQTGPRTS